MYLFAGKRRQSDIGSALREFECMGKIRLQLQDFDIERSPDHDLREDALWLDIKTCLAEGSWFLIVSPPCNTFSRARFQFLNHPGPRPVRNVTWPKGFPWLSNSNKGIVDEANQFVLKCLDMCHEAFAAQGHFILEHPEDLGIVQGERPGSIWQWPELHELLTVCSASCFAVHQCHFGAETPKPTRFATSFPVVDSRCHLSLPKFDKIGKYLGPLPRDCGHHHEAKLIGKTAQGWKTAPSAAYPPELCRFIAQLILNVSTSVRKGQKDKPRSVSDSLGHPSKKLRSGSTLMPPVDSQASSSSCLVDVIDLDSKEPTERHDQVTDFEMESCLNRGRPMLAEWDNKSHEFIDGFGLCSPARWPPLARGERRSSEMHQLAAKTFSLLERFVIQHITDHRLLAFKLVTGKLASSPFPEDEMHELRKSWASLLKDPKDAGIVDEGQPFYLRALSQWLKVFEDPDVHWLVDESDSFASGVPLGVEEPLPRSPQVFPPKVRHRKLDETEFNPLAVNYPSGQLSRKELEEKFREEESLGRMFPSKLSVLRTKYGEHRVRVAAMAAIAKPDGSVRPLHDATHSVKVNHSIVYQDQIQCPGPAEIAAVVREAFESREAPFCVSADIKAAHRLVKIREEDWGYTCCRADSASDVVWVNRTGTFGVSSAPYWWAKLCGLIGRFVGHLMQTSLFLHMIYVDDLHGVFLGERKFLDLWIWLLAFELAGTPFGYHKFKGGVASEFVGFNLRYDLTEVGISDKRGQWLIRWIVDAKDKRWVVPAKDFSEFLGRLCFVAQLLVWLKPHLAPLFAWTAVVGPGTVGRLPEAVILTLHYILAELVSESFRVSAKAPVCHTREAFRTDAKCTDTFVVLGGWELGSRRWFSLKLTKHDVPYLFREGGGSQWASTSAELLGTLAALHAFGWLVPADVRRSTVVSLSAGTDNQANESLSIKRSSTKWPLMAINMQLSASLSKARLGLRLRWRPRDENEEADDLTNEVFGSFSESLRVPLTLQDLDLKILSLLVEAREAFDVARAKAKADKGSGKGSLSKRFDKSPW